MEVLLIIVGIVFVLVVTDKWVKKGVKKLKDDYGIDLEVKQNTASKYFNGDNDNKILFYMRTTRETLDVVQFDLSKPNNIVGSIFSIDKVQKQVIGKSTVDKFDILETNKMIRNMLNHGFKCVPQYKIDKELRLLGMQA